MSNGEHEIRTPKGLRIGNRSVVDGKNMLQIGNGDSFVPHASVARNGSTSNADRRICDFYDTAGGR